MSQYTMQSMSEHTSRQVKSVPTSDGFARLSRARAMFLTIVEGRNYDGLILYS